MGEINYSPVDVSRFGNRFDRQNYHSRVRNMPRPRRYGHSATRTPDRTVEISIMVTRFARHGGNPLMDLSYPSRHAAISISTT